MYNTFKQHPGLFVALFIIPIFFYLAVCQLSILEVARHKGFGLIFTDLPIRICLAIEGLTLGSLGGLISVIVATTAFHLFPKWKHSKILSTAYAAFWLVPFCGLSLFGYAMTCGAPGMTFHRGPVQEIADGLFGFSLIGVISGGIGLLAFTSLQMALSSLEQ